MGEFPHKPVLLNETLKMLDPKPGEAIFDATVGLGGHSKAFAEVLGEEGTLVICDADARNLERAEDRLHSFRGELKAFHGNFRNISQCGFESFDVIFADLGVSSPHFDDPERGFSFRQDGPLDMRYDKSSGVSAAEFITESSEDDLADVFRSYGELRLAYKLARAVKEANPQTTQDLYQCIDSVYGFRAKSLAPQAFQALRIAVNDEVEALRGFLTHAVQMLASGGRLGVISYHSLEDRLVKQTFRALSLPEIDEVTGQITRSAEFEVLTKKPIIPTEEEIEANPRSRSAKLRVLKRSDA